MLPIFALLAAKKIRFLREHNKRVLFFDPAPIYRTQPVNVYKRVQASLEFSKLFPPKLDKTCACGCGLPLNGRRTRWATRACAVFAITIWEIIDGRQATIRKFLKMYHSGWKCALCNTPNQVRVYHIIPVKHGGGGCWVNNYQLLCHNCHVQKTNTDFGWKKIEIV